MASQVLKKRKRTQQDDMEDAAAEPGPSKASTSTFKQKVLLLSSRGVTFRMRHLLHDLAVLLPHAKKDAKLDSKHQLYMVNELAELASCNNALFFEARRHQDLYLWAAKTPNGPSVRFHVLNSHTMDELKMTGNCLKGSRPILCFDAAFDAQPHLRLIKELLTHIFAVPASSKKAKPFVDHVTSFSLADGKLWFRNFQLLASPVGELSAVDLQAALPALGPAAARPSNKAARTAPKLALSEIGPRFVLVPIKIFEGAFNGAVLYENTDFVPPSMAQLARKQDKAGKYRARKEAQTGRQAKLGALEAARADDPLETRRLFA